MLCTDILPGCGKFHQFSCRLVLQIGKRLFRDAQLYKVRLDVTISIRIYVFNI